MTHPYHQPIPGPYAYTLEAEGCDDLLQITSTVGDRESVAEIRFWNDYTPERNGKLEATARLLAAAPELRDALKRAVLAIDAFYGRRNPDDELRKAVLAAKMILEHVSGPRPLNERVFVIPTQLADADRQAAAAAEGGAL